MDSNNQPEVRTPRIVVQRKGGGFVLVHTEPACLAEHIILADGFMIVPGLLDLNARTGFVFPTVTCMKETQDGEVITVEYGEEDGIFRWKGSGVEIARTQRGQDQSEAVDAVLKGLGYEVELIDMQETHNGKD